METSGRQVKEKKRRSRQKYILTVLAIGFVTPGKMEGIQELEEETGKSRDAPRGRGAVMGLQMEG